MKVLVVYAHGWNPQSSSFNHAVLEAFTKGLKDGGHTFEVVDLYAIKFDPCLKFQDMAQFLSGYVPKDIKDRMKLGGCLGINEMYKADEIPPEAIDNVREGEQVFQELTELPFTLNSLTE